MNLNNYVNYYVNTNKTKKYGGTINDFVSNYIDINTTFEFDNEIKMNDKFSIPEKGWYIYGRPSCPYTIKAINLLSSNNTPIYSINIGHNIDKLKEDIKTYNDTNSTKKLSIPSFNTIPIIYYNQKLIGGCSDLVNWLKVKNGGKINGESNDEKKINDNHTINQTINQNHIDIIKKIVRNNKTLSLNTELTDLINQKADTGVILHKMNFILNSKDKGIINKWGNVKRSASIIYHKYGDIIREIQSSKNIIENYIDYGSGDGFHSFIFGSIFKAKHIYCLDINDYRLENYKSVNIKFIKNNDKNSLGLDEKNLSKPVNTPIKPNSVNLITLLQTLHHVEFEGMSPEETRDKVITDLTKLAAKNCYLILREHDYTGDSKILSNILFEHLVYEINDFKGIKSIDEISEFINTYDKKHQGSYFSYDNIKENLNKHGWELIGVKPEISPYNFTRIYTVLFRKNT